jgi:TMEM175 potassium channel family protein
VTEPPARHLPESTRVEAFSDGVLAIAITLLVLDLHSDFDHNRFAHGLAGQWPAYIAYLAAFLNISAIWINHHDLFTRVRAVDARLITLNLLLLLVASLFPWPAAVISAAQRTGDRRDQITASLLYAGIGFLVPLTFIAIYTYLNRTPRLLTDPSHTDYTRTSRRRAFVSIITYPVTAALAFWSPTADLALFIAVPGYFIASVFTQERVESHRSYPASVRRNPEPVEQRPEHH